MKRFFCCSLLTIIFIVCAQATTVSDSSPLSLKITSGTLEAKRDVAVPTRDIIIGNDGAQVRYSFENVLLSRQSINQKSGRFSLEYPGFRSAMGDGLPQIPMRADVLVVAESSSVKISVDSSEYVDYKMELAPSFPAVADNMDSKSVDILEVADYDGFYPKEPVMEIQSSLLHNLKLVYVRVSPVQYDSKNKTVRIYSNLSYRIDVTTSDEFYSSIKQRELEEIANLYHSGATILLEIKNKADKIKSINNGLSDSSPEYSHNGIIRANDTYLIICGNKTKNAADKLAEWKKSIGYNAKVVSSMLWRKSALSLYIENYYSNSLGRMYCLFFGDEKTIPTCERNSLTNYFSDCPYFCLKGNDKIPEVKYARIPCSTLSEAEIAVDKIINYEKNPPTSSLFYKTGINVAMFSDYIDAETQSESICKPDGYEDSRFTETSYEIAQYLKKNSLMTIKEYYRLYRPVCEGEHLVWHWSKIHSYGERVTNDVPITCEHYDFNYNKFLGWLNKGALYVFYRGHGSDQWWGNMEIGSSTFGNASNGVLLPYCFSICCDNGIDMGNTFPKSMMMNPNGGAIGCFASTGLSYSVLNDGLAHGIFNAFWPSPGITSDFVYIPAPLDSNIPCNIFIPYSYERTYEVFDAVQQGFLRSEQIFPTLSGHNSDQREIYSLFGDPAQIIYTNNPYSIRSHTTFTVERNEDKVVVNYPYQKGVITVYDKSVDVVKTFINASNVNYYCDDPESVVVSVKCGSALTQVNVGGNVNL